MSARRAVSARRALFVPAALALGAALTLTACQSGGDGGEAKPAQSAASGAPASTGTSTGAAPDGTAGAGAAPAAQPAAGAPAPAAGAPSAAAPAAGTSARPKNPAASAPGSGGGAGGAGAGAGAGGEAYAYSHPCEARSLTVKVTARAEAPTQRVIEVRNQGTTACGLSYYPLVSLGDSKAADHGKDVTPLVPSGLGGAPAYAVAPGQTAYAVLDLNPGGGGAAGVDQLNVLPDGEHMPTAETRNFPLGAGAKAGRPKLGLYGATVAEAAASAATADRQA
ncbi:DUF4232 domain-containing protein [Kitasatospora sp. NPDC092039]|uniref:DUF4232 domain-containing protein n=1 Tax=Kitasatospora sp. NPDC092039 TaxID=3364086 RepID=UPI0037FA6263